MRVSNGCLREGVFGVVFRFLDRGAGLRGKGNSQSAVEVTRPGRFTYSLSSNPLNRHNYEDIPGDVQSTPLATYELVRLVGDQSLGVVVEELGDHVGLLWSLRQRLEYLSLFPLSPFSRIGGKEKPWTINDLGDLVRTESKVLSRPHAIRETTGAKVVEEGEIGGKETVSTNKSDDAIRTTTSTLDN